MTQEDVQQLTKEERERLLNPHLKLGFIYMCHACQTLELPSVMEGLTEDGARKRNMPHCSKTKSRKSRKSLEPPSPRRSVTFATVDANADVTPQNNPNQALHNVLSAESTANSNSAAGTAENPVIVTEDLPGSIENPLIIGDNNTLHTSSIPSNPSEELPKQYAATIKEEPVNTVHLDVRTVYALINILNTAKNCYVRQQVS